MPEHHNTSASRQKAEHFFLKYARLPLGERSLTRLQAVLQEENISVSPRTLERYSERYDWPGQLRQLSAQDQAAAAERVDEIRIRRREYYYTREQQPQEWAAERLSVAVHNICPNCADNLRNEKNSLRLCQRCTEHIRPLMLALQEGPPDAAVLKWHFELELLEERRNGLSLEDYMEPSEPSCTG